MALPFPCIKVVLTVALGTSILGGGIRCGIFLFITLRCVYKFWREFGFSLFGFMNNLQALRDPLILV